MTTALKNRLLRLEGSTQFHVGGVGCAIALEGAETVEDACKRLDLPDASGRIVVGQILESDHWCRVAHEQQQRLTSDNQFHFEESQ
jgi:hypothetical protein